jgi:hypothetical protein
MHASSTLQGCQGYPGCPLPHRTSYSRTRDWREPGLAPASGGSSTRDCSASSPSLSEPYPERVRNSATSAMRPMSGRSRRSSALRFLLQV